MNAMDTIMDKINSSNISNITNGQDVSWKQVCGVGVACVALGTVVKKVVDLHRKHLRERAQTHKLAMLMNVDLDDRLTWSATQLGKALRRKDFTAVELFHLAKEHTLKVNSILNAVVAFRWDEALAEAQEADRILEQERLRRSNEYRSASSNSKGIDMSFMDDAGDLPYWLGVPAMAKECMEFEGLPYTAGLKSRAKRGIIGAHTCPVLKRLQERTGVVFLGVGNLSEGCMWMESDNQVYGTTNNLYDVSRMVGGSSGGTSCAIAACCSPVGVTSDVGGSTRIPAFYNGIFGHKPTGGTVSNAANIPECEGRVNWICQLGPSALHAEDLFPMLETMAGPLTQAERALHPEHPSIADNGFQTQVFKWPNPNTVNINALTILSVSKQPSSIYPASRRHPEITERHKEVVRHLETKYRQNVKGIEFDLLQKSFDIWGAQLNGCGGAPFDEIISQDKEHPHSHNSVVELFKWILTGGRCTDHTLPALMLAIFEKLTDLSPSHSAQLRQDLKTLRQQIHDALGPNGVMIVPSLPMPAPKHGPITTLVRFTDCAATCIFNVLELPVTAVPLGLTKDGLPIGVQIVSRERNDHLTLALASALEADGIAKWERPIYSAHSGVHQ